MKFLKFILGIIIVFSLTITSTLFFVYQSLNRSILSYDENIKFLTSTESKSEMGDLISRNAASQNLPETYFDYDSQSFAAFVNSMAENTMAYLFLKEDTIKEFDKGFINEITGIIVETAINNATQENSTLALMMSNLENIDVETAKLGLIQVFNENDISYTLSEIDEIVANVYSEIPTEEKLISELTYFLSNKIVFEFNPEKAIEGMLFLPRLVNEKINSIFGKWFLIGLVLLVLLTVTIFFKRRSVFIIIFISAVLSIIPLQLFKSFAIKIMQDSISNLEVFSSYYNNMINAFSKSIDFMSILAGLIVLIFLIINIFLIIRERKKSDYSNQDRYVKARTAVAIILVLGIGYVNYSVYSEIEEVKTIIEDGSIEREFQNFDNILNIKFDL